MTALYTVLIPPVRVTEQEAEFIHEYRRANRITVSETLRQCVKALQANGREFERAQYGTTKLMLPGFLVDADTAEFIKDLAFDLDISKCQVIRSAIDCMRKEVNEKISN